MLSKCLVDDTKPLNGQPKRPKKLRGARDKRHDPLIVKTFVDAVRTGHFFRDACQAAGISEDTFYRWMAEAREPGKKRRHVREFAEAVRKAEYEAINRNLLCIQTAAKDDWKAAAHYLALRRPKEFNVKKEDKPVVEVESSVQKLPFDPALLPLDMRRQFENMLEVMEQLQAQKQLKNITEYGNQNGSESADQAGS